MTSLAEENYLKAIYKLHEKNGGMVSTSALAETLEVSAASVTDFIKKMAVKKLVAYEKSRGVRLTDTGKFIAISIIRKHRLWEVWLVSKLGFKWDEVHDIAEQLEHVTSEELIENLDKHLGYPKADPHGDLIPDARGRFAKTSSKPLLEYPAGSKVKLTGVENHSNSFLQYLTKNQLSLGDEIMVEAIEEFDETFHVKINKKHQKLLSREVVKNLLVVPL
ncbi:MAG TPA: metal-dependent transcriptional regulator [Ferruginibacter sp.]|nr:metal-dependent transcriptional regulator [Ferruginibacter sp.]HMP22146.1 metal-dependent transcriptional regulator [Ferruginibacter sp.]